MDKFPDDAAGGMVRIAAGRFLKLIVVFPRFGGDEFVKDGMASPASQGKELARPDASFHLRQGGETVMDIPERHVNVVIFVVGPVGTHLDHGCGGEARAAPGDLGAVHTANLGEISGTVSLPAGNHLTRASVIAFQQVVRSRVEEGMGAVRPEQEKIVSSPPEFGLVHEPLGHLHGARIMGLVPDGAIVRRPQVARALKRLGNVLLM